MRPTGFERRGRVCADEPFKSAAQTVRTRRRWEEVARKEEMEERVARRRAEEQQRQKEERERRARHRRESAASSDAADGSPGLESLTVVQLKELVRG